MNTVLEFKKTKICSKLKTTELVQINLIFLMKLKLLPVPGRYRVPISLIFLFFSSIFSLLDPDPGGKMNVDPRGSGSTALKNISIKIT